MDQLTHDRLRAHSPAAARSVKRGSSGVRMEVIELLYGNAAVAGLPATKLTQHELGIPHRTAPQRRRQHPS